MVEPDPVADLRARCAAYPTVQIHATEVAGLLAILDAERADRERAEEAHRRVFATLTKERVAALVEAERLRVDREKTDSPDLDGIALLAATMMYLYPHYRVRDRSARGCLFDIIAATRPDLAKRLEDGAEWSELMDVLDPQEDGPRGA